MNIAAMFTHFTHYPKIKNFVDRIAHPFSEPMTVTPAEPIVETQSIDVLRDAMENLHTALATEFRTGKHAAAQEKTRLLIQQAMALNIALHRDSAPYSWYAYYSEKNAAEQLSQQLMRLKEALPHTWANATRAEVRALSFAYAHYFTACKHNLEKKLFSGYRQATFQMYH